MSKTKVVTTFLVFTLAVMFLAVAGFVSAQQQPTIKVGVAPTTSSSGLYLAKLRGYFEEQGLKVELVGFGGSGAEMIALIAADQFQVGGGSLTPGIFNAAAKGMKVKIVGDKARIIANPDESHDVILVRQDHVDSGRYKGPKDLRGMKVAMGSPGYTNCMIIGLDRLLVKHGMSIADVEVIGVKYPAMIGALRAKQVDAACALEPFVAKAEQMGLAKCVQGLGETMPNFQVAVIFYSPDFAEKHRADAEKFMIAYAKGLRDYKNAFEHGVGTEGVINDLVKVLKVKDRDLYKKMRVVGFHPDACLDMEDIAEAQEWYNAHDQVPNKVNLDELVDNSFCEHVRKTLGEFKPGE